MQSKVSKRGQVSIPSAVRKKLQIGPNTLLVWTIEGDTARVVPLSADTIGAFRGSGKKGMVRRMLNERRADRKRENGPR